MAAGTKAAVQLFQLATSSSLSSSSSSSPSQASLNDEAAKRSHQSMEESLFASVMRMQKLGELVRQRQETAAHIIEVCTHLLALLPSPIYSEETVGTSYNVRPPFHEGLLSYFLITLFQSVFLAFSLSALMTLSLSVFMTFSLPVFMAFSPSAFLVLHCRVY